jgi:glycosyltransferase involved in cell wall biosynthesis
MEKLNDRRGKKLSILHIVLSIGETNATYNEHCLPWAEQRDITICTFFHSPIKPPKSITFFEGDNTVPGFIRNLNQVLDAKEYDIIHAHTPHVGLLFLVSQQLTRHNSQLPSVITVHDSYPNYKFRNRLMFLPVFAGFRRIVCCSKASYNSFPNIYKRLAGERLFVVQNGLDIVRVDRIAANNPKPTHKTNEFSVIAISRLVDIKNPFTLVAAFQQSADRTSRLVYIGEGPLRNTLNSVSENNGYSSQIEFTGLIPRERVFEHLLNADLFISTSRGEGLPIAVLEAMACRNPVLLSDIPPHREIAEGVDFIPLIDPDDVAGFAREIKRFRQMSPAERVILGQNCRELVEARFSLDAMHSGYEEIYTQLINHHKV